VRVKTCLRIKRQPNKPTQIPHHRYALGERPCISPAKARLKRRDLFAQTKEKVAYLRNLAIQFWLARGRLDYGHLCSSPLMRGVPLRTIRPRKGPRLRENLEANPGQRMNAPYAPPHSKKGAPKDAPYQ